MDQHRRQEEQVCSACYDCVGDDCGDICRGECERIVNMQENGYVDAAEFLECQMMYEDDVKSGLYAGPICANEGSTIKRF